MRDRRYELTDMEVLQAVANAVAPWSNYIGDEVRRKRNFGHPVPAARILRRLRKLAKDGLVEQRSKVPDGYYGFYWQLTDAGIAALEAQREAA